MLDQIYIIPLLPLLAFGIIVFFTRWKETLSAGISIGLMSIAWLFSVTVLIKMLAGADYTAEHSVTILQYLTADQNFLLELGTFLDPLTAIMLIVVTTVGLMVQIYSLGYMHGDPRFSRYYAYLSLFTFSMLGLVVANNFFMIFIFWELVGLTSYLLIGFWFEKKSASDAGKKAFITTKIGDLGFMIGLMMMMLYIGTFNYQEVFQNVESGMVSGGILTAIALLVFCGAVGKSAQFPLHVWLPDAMEGPTPVSALIHAATMVAAGVYLVARSLTLFIPDWHAFTETGALTDASMTVAWIGLFTSFFAASIALVQNDIKRILAFSTLSQLGYMIMVLGLGGYTAGTFHLMTHAFFKALLFLGAGSVIHAVHTNDIQLMGGLFGKMKTTAMTFAIATLAISGIPPLSGFWSKDEIIAATHGHMFFTFVALLVAFMTAFYMCRLFFLTFLGTPRDQEKYDHAHESPRSMTFPLIFLAVLSVVSGFAGMPWLEHGYASFVYHGHAHHPQPDYWLMLISTAVAVSGITLAYMMYYKKKISADMVAEKFKPIYNLFYNKYYLDELYNFVLIRPVYAIGRFMWSFDARVIDGFVNLQATITMWLAAIKFWFDQNIVDGIVNGMGIITDKFSGRLRKTQSGRLSHYLLAIIFGLIVIGLLATANLLRGTFLQAGLG